jgi:enoyl-CoA hydratase/carnithine racemase
MRSIDLIEDTPYATLTMGNNGKFNANSLAAFNQALDQCLENEEIQALIITGEGKMFAEGLDLEFMGTIGAESPDKAMDFVKSCLLMIGRLLTFPVPVVSAINGHAFGLGAMIVLASDYKVMREDRGYFCLPEVDLGMTLTERMNALVKGKLQGNVLRDVLLTGKRIAGPEAAENGIVDCSCPENELAQKAKSLAEPMMGKNRKSLSGLKRGINLDILEVIEADAPDITI